MGRIRYPACIKCLRWPFRRIQCEFLKEYHKAFDELDFMVGEQVWAFADFQTKQGLNRIDGNKKGVFTGTGQPKMAAWLLRERWTGRSVQRRIMDA